MGPVELSARSFSPFIDRARVALVEFRACRGEWQRMEPAFEQVAALYPELAWGLVDVDAEPSIAKRLQIDSVPTLVGFCRGVPLVVRPGLLTECMLEALVTKVTALDVDDLRARVAALLRCPQARSR